MVFTAYFANLQEMKPRDDDIKNQMASLHFFVEKLHFYEEEYYSMMLLPNEEGQETRDDQQWKSNVANYCDICAYFLNSVNLSFRFG